ncbi:MAG: glycosyltransferase, partial [Solirubrobacteraceae bacterium]
RGLGLRPRTATLGPDCAYLRRPALDRAGPPPRSGSDDRAGAGSGARGLDDYLDELATRCLALGMSPVAADDVAVQASGRSRARRPDASAAARADGMLASEPAGALRRARKRGELALGRLSVTIDARSLTEGSFGGTQTYVLGLTRALAHLPALSLRALVPPDLSDVAAKALASFPEIELLSVEQAMSAAPSDVAHRPQQAFSLEDVALLRLLGERVIVTHQDLIGYHNRSYHADAGAWRRYRDVTRLALAAVDQVVFFSEHARDDALAEQLLGEERAHVVGIGLEPSAPAQEEPPTPPGCGAPTPPGAAAPVPPEAAASGPEIDPAPAGPFLLCLGADYAHKNRPFAIELLAALRRLGWRGRLVLAGPHVPYGSSADEERLLLEPDPELAEHVTDLGPVEEQTKQSLLANARALLYPTVYEGFGLLPLEAARGGIPCLFAAHTSLAELAGEAATLVPWDAVASAVAAAPLLADGDARDAHLAALERVATPSWSDVADRLLAVYEEAASGPPAPAAAWQELDRERYLELSRELRYHRDLAKEYQEHFARVSYGLPLIDDDGMLTRQQQRGLMRIASHRAPRRLVLPWLGLLGRPLPGRRAR